MEGQLRAQAKSCEEAGEEAEGMEWTRTLAGVLSDQGRHADAVVMFERVLEFRIRAQPEDHFSTGEGLVWIHTSHALLFIVRWCS